ncbi:MAG: formylglycine-generating enzyme family protein [Thermoanaerobaculia bacterium]
MRVARLRTLAARAAWTAAATPADSSASADRLRVEYDRLLARSSMSDADSFALVPVTVPIPAGRLVTVEIAAFRLGRTVVTNREYGVFLAGGRAAPPPWWNDPHFSAPLQPVVGVTWDEATAYCAWLSDLTRLAWRLPTEAEWELAASGGLSAPRTPWGDAIPRGEIPEGAISGPWEAGRGTPNGYGLLDPGTFVHEWCLDSHEPPGGGPRRRASRGGSWRHAIRWSSPSARSSLPPDYRYSDYGFRVLRG